MVVQAPAMSLSELDSLVASGHRALVVHGGSGISLRRSPTSDRDFFVIADERLLPALSGVWPACQRQM